MQSQPAVGLFRKKSKKGKKPGFSVGSALSKALGELRREHIYIGWRRTTTTTLMHQLHVFSATLMLLVMCHTLIHMLD